jgi:hypothetical protein
MTNRREFLQTGAVSAIAASGVITRWAEAVGAAPPAVLGRALYDDRYAAGRRFAATMGAQGVATSALDGGDITRLYLELEQLWQRSSLAVAGFTQFGPMLVVERLGLERGMRLAMRMELLTPKLEPPTLPAGTESPLIHYYTPQAEQQGYGPALKGPLYSWVVAPRAKRG